MASYFYMDNGKGFQTKQGHLKTAPSNKERSPGVRVLASWKIPYRNWLSPYIYLGSHQSHCPAIPWMKGAGHLGFLCDILVGMDKSRCHSCEIPLLPWVHSGLGPSRGQALNFRVSMRFAFTKYPPYGHFFPYLVDLNGISYKGSNFNRYLNSFK